MLGSTTAFGRPAFLSGCFFLFPLSFLNRLLGWFSPTLKILQAERTPSCDYSRAAQTHAIINILKWKVIRACKFIIIQTCGGFFAVSLGRCSASSAQNWTPSSLQPRDLQTSPVTLLNSQTCCLCNMEVLLTHHLTPIAMVKSFVAGCLPLPLPAGPPTPCRIPTLLFISWERRPAAPLFAGRAQSCQGKQEPNQTFQPGKRLPSARMLTCVARQLQFLFVFMQWRIERRERWQSHLTESRAHFVTPKLQRGRSYFLNVLSQKSRSKTKAQRILCFLKA